MILYIQNRCQNEVINLKKGYGKTKDNEKGNIQDIENNTTITTINNIINHHH